MKSKQVTVTTTAQQVWTGDEMSTEIVVQNDSGGTIYLGGSDVTSSNGFALSNNTMLTFKCLAFNDIWTVVASGTRTLSVLHHDTD